MATAPDVPLETVDVSGKRKHDYSKDSRDSPNPGHDSVLNSGALLYQHSYYGTQFKSNPVTNPVVPTTAFLSPNVTPPLFLETVEVTAPTLGESLALYLPWLAIGLGIGASGIGALPGASTRREDYAVGSPFTNAGLSFEGVSPDSQGALETVFVTAQRGRATPVDTFAPTLGPDAFRLPGRRPVSFFAGDEFAPEVRTEPNPVAPPAKPPVIAPPGQVGDAFDWFRWIIELPDIFNPPGRIYTGPPFPTEPITEFPVYSPLGDPLLSPLGFPSPKPGTTTRPGVAPRPLALPLSAPIGAPYASPFDLPLVGPGTRPGSRPDTKPGVAPKPSSKPRPLTLPSNTPLPFFGTPTDPGTLTEFQPGIAKPPVETDTCQCKPKKRKPRQPRTDCKRGTYQQTAKGIIYHPKETFPCP